MNFNEALQVLRRINVHHGNAPISDAQAQCFYEELSRSVSFDEANAAVREFYALHPHGEWMTVGDINLAVEKETTAVDAIGGDHHPADGGEPDFRPRRDVAVPTLSAQIIGPWPSRHAGGAACVGIVPSPDAGRPEGRGDEKPAADTAGGKPRSTRSGPGHDRRPKHHRRTLGSAASGGIAPDIARTSNQKNAIRKNRLEKKQMADITTQTIRDTSWTTFPKT